MESQVASRKSAERFPEPYQDWIALKEFADVARVCQKTARRRTRPGYPGFVVSAKVRLPDGRQIILINPRSMTFDEQQRLKQMRLKQETGRAEKEPRSRSAAACARPEDAQHSLFLRNEVDDAIEQARRRLAPSQFGVAMQRYRATQPVLNHDFKAQGFATKGDFERVRAREIGVSQRHFQRWIKEFREVLSTANLTEAFIALADERPGPERGTVAIDNSMKAFLWDCWVLKKLTRSQCCRALHHYLEEKQRGCGARWAYEVPSDSTVCRFINAPEPYGLGGDSNPLRGGQEAVKTACGYIDQAYDHELAGDAWLIDEKELDGAFYNPLRRREIYWSLYAISVIDERTTKVLGIKIAYRLNADTVLDLLEEVLRNYWVPKWLVSDSGGHFRGKVLRRTRVQSRSKLVERAMGAMDSFGVKAGGPRGDHNPRGNRLERLHGIYSDLAREQFGPSWRGRNVEERKMTGIDKRVERHIREHCKDGTCGPLILSTDDAECLVAGWMDRVNQADTDAKGCAGMTRQAAFEAFKPSVDEIERRRVSQAQIDEAFAERDARVIRTGGIIEAHDGLRYSSPELIARTGEKVPFSRLRRDRMRIYVEIDGQVVVAPHRVPVQKRTDPEHAAREAEKLARINRLYARLSGVPTLENAPESAEKQAAQEAFRAAQESSLRRGKPVPMTMEPVAAPEIETEAPGIGFADLE